MKPSTIDAPLVLVPLRISFAMGADDEPETSADTTMASAFLRREQKRLRIASTLVEKYNKIGLPLPCDLMEFVHHHVSKRAWEAAAQTCRKVLAERVDLSLEN